MFVCEKPFRAAEGFFVSVCGPVFVGRTPHHLLEQTREVLRVAESQRVGDFADRASGVEDAFLGDVDHLELDVLLGRFPGLLLHQVAEIVRRQVQLLGAPTARRPARGGLLRNSRPADARIRPARRG